VIGFDPKMEVDEYLPNVVIYINADKHTILQVVSDYNTHQQYAQKVNLIFILASVEKNKMTAIYSDGDLPLLRYCRIDQDLRIKLGKNKGVLGSLAEVLIHGNGGLKAASDYTGSNVYKKGNIYKNGNKYTEEFWYKYNTLLPTAEEIKVLQEAR